MRDGGESLGGTLGDVQLDSYLEWRTVFLHYVQLKSHLVSSLICQWVYKVP